MGINKVILIGNVGKDPDIRHLEGGASVATITLATSERYRDRNGETKEQTEWHNIVAWRQLADLAGNYIKKGSQIYVEGRLRTRSWDDQNGNKRYVTEILADSIQLLGRKSDSNSIPTGGAYTPPAQPSYNQPTPQSSGSHFQRPEPGTTSPAIPSSALAEDDSDDLPF